jgi:hypothetical protein
VLGPLLRLWQGDPWNNNPLTFAIEKVACLTAREISGAATWAEVVKGGKTQRLLEGVVPTNDVTSVDCKQDCAWVSPELDAAVQVRARASLPPARRGRAWSCRGCFSHCASANLGPPSRLPHPDLNPVLVAPNNRTSTLASKRLGWPSTYPMSRP